MKRLLILLLAMILLLTACNPLGAIDYFSSGSESENIKQMSTDILNCFTENDKESFKELFCEQAQNSPDFDEQVDKAFEYCNGTVYFTDTTIKTIASGGSNTEKGTLTEWYVNPEIPYFEVVSTTDSGDRESRYYAIYYRWYIRYAPDKTKEGLHYLTLELLNVDSMTIGERISLSH